ncbi:MAG: family 1 glycosylhydrolase [Anaerolineaceae bacterium]|nr:family 1 glycosylhydrolase [Anaerolineaceae bacterium]
MALHNLYDRYKIPDFVVGNGLGAVDQIQSDGSVHDADRIEYLRRHARLSKPPCWKMAWTGSGTPPGVGSTW